MSPAPAPADAVVACIQSAIDDAEAGVLRFKLMNLKTFVLCTRKLGNNANLTSLLLWIEDVVGKETVDSIEIESLEEEIHDWYITMFDYAHSTSLLVHQASELISSILETLADFNGVEWMEIFREQLTFLKCPIEFASPESSKLGLMVHAESVAMDAAYLLFTCNVDEDDEAEYREMEFKISSLLIRVRPTDLQTYEIYTQVLSSSKLLDHGGNVVVTVRLLLASLLSNLWWMLQLNACRAVPLMYQLHELYRGLRSLRSVFDKQLSFDVKMKENIVAVVCAGILICSLYCHQTQQVDLGLQKLLETMALILEEFGKEDPRVSIFNFRRANELGFIDILSNQLKELISCGAEPAAVSCLQTIQEELVFLKNFFMDNVELCNDVEELRAGRDHALEMAFKLKNLTDHLEVGDLSYSSLPLFDSIMKDIGSIKDDVLKVFNDKRPEAKAHEAAQNRCQMLLPRISLMTNEIVGHGDQVKILLDRLTRGLKKLQITAIVGVGGIGKTTLATRVYNDPSTAHRFHIRACYHVLQVVDTKRMLLELLIQISTQREGFFELTEEDLASMVRRSLKGRRYLIFLDDVWDIKIWNALKFVFPDDHNGSRIIITSHFHHVAPDEIPHIVGLLSAEESLELLQRKLFPGSDGVPMILRKPAVQIVGICRGLPLAILLTAGFLATVEPKPDVWDKIWHGLSSKGIVSSSEVCWNILELSYEYLPDYLKLCFLYLAAFQNDQEVPVQRLLRLWIAEGFVQKDLMENLEIVAEAYLKDLIGRELIMVAKRKSDGGIKTCRVHDLVRNVCLGKVKDERFFHFLKGYDELLAYNNQSDLWRLIIDSKPKHLKESRLFCPQVRSLLFKSSQQTKRDELDTSFLAHTFKLLHVLDIEQCNVGRVFPSEVEELVQLAFLAIRGKMRRIPSSIVKLSKLETLIVDAGTEILALPDSLGNVTSLQFLYIRSSRSSGGAALPETNLVNSCVLHGLETFCGAVIPSWGILGKLMRKFPSIRKLKCRRAMDDDTENVDEIVVLHFMSHLESLHLSSVNSCRFKFSLPANLKKLTVSGFHLVPKKMSTIGNMPNLQVLKLLHVSFEGNTWQVQEAEFWKLRALKLHSPGLVTWNVEEDGLCCLEKLAVNGCLVLEELPSFLGEIPTLDVIEVSNCSRAAVDSVMGILEEQREYGNDVLKVSVDNVCS